MSIDHWFDRLNKALVRENPRRTLLAAASAAVASAGLFALPDSGAGKKGKKGQKGKKGNTRGKKRKKPGKPRPPTPATCSGACDRAYAYSRSERDYCEFICRQCDGDDPREFCILGDPGGSIPIAAACCQEGLACCEGQCVDTESAYKYCGGCSFDCANAFPFIPDIDPAADVMCCNGTCTYIRENQYDCGACNQRCLAGDGKKCCDHQCRDIDNFDKTQCGHSCDPCPAARPECCHGSCYDPDIFECCRNHPRGPAGSCVKPLTCCTLGTGEPGCCAP